MPGLKGSVLPLPLHLGSRSITEGREGSINFSKFKGFKELFEDSVCNERLLKSNHKTGLNGKILVIPRGTHNILSFDVNEQLMIMVQTTHKVKERACPYLQRCLVNVTRPDKWSHNNCT